MRVRASQSSADSQDADLRLIRMSTLVFTLFTFCPPAPPLLAKLVMTSSAHRGASELLRLEPQQQASKRPRLTAQCLTGAATVAQQILSRKRSLRWGYIRVTCEYLQTQAWLTKGDRTSKHHR